MQHPLIPRSDGSRLVGINSGHHKNSIFNLLRRLLQPAEIIQHGVFIVRRAGTDNQQEPVILSLKYILNDFIPFRFDPFDFRM